MATYLEFHTDLITVADKIEYEGAGAYAELFNRFGEINGDDTINFFVSEVGSELDESGRNFLRLMARVAAEIETRGDF